MPLRIVRVMAVPRVAETCERPSPFRSLFGMSESPK